MVHDLDSVEVKVRFLDGQVATTEIIGRSLSKRGNLWAVHRTASMFEAEDFEVEDMCTDLTRLIRCRPRTKAEAEQAVYSGTLTLVEEPELPFY